MNDSTDIEKLLEFFKERGKIVSIAITNNEDFKEYKIRIEPTNLTQNSSEFY